MTRRTFFPWLKEFNLIVNMTQRFLWKFFFDSKNWTFFEYDSKNWTSFMSQNWIFLWLTTQRIELFFEYDSKYWDSFSIWLKELNLLLANDSKTWTLFYICLKELNLSWKRKRWLEELTDLLKNMNQIIETLMTQRIELLLKKTVTHRTEPFFHMIHRIEPFFPTWRVKNWTLLFNMTQRIGPFFFTNVSSKIFFCKKYSKNWTCFWVWLKELNLFEHDSKNWFFLNMIHRNEPFFQHYSKDGTFESMTQRIGHFLIWLKELNLLFYMTPRTELFFRGIELFFSQIWIKELIFQKFHFKLLTFFFKWLTELNSSYRTQRLENFFIWVKEQ